MRVVLLALLNLLSVKLVSTQECNVDYLEYPKNAGLLRQWQQDVSCTAFVCENDEECLSDSIDQDDVSDWTCYLEECSTRQLLRIKASIDWSVDEARSFMDKLQCGQASAGRVDRDRTRNRIMWFEWNAVPNPIVHPMVYADTVEVSDCEDGTDSGWWISKIFMTNVEDGDLPDEPDEEEEDASKCLLEDVQYSPLGRRSLSWRLASDACTARVCESSEDCIAEAVEDATKWTCYTRSCTNINTQAIGGVLEWSTDDAVKLAADFICDSESANGAGEVESVGSRIMWLVECSEENRKLFGNRFEWSDDLNFYEHLMLYNESISMPSCDDDEDTDKRWMSKLYVMDINAESLDRLQVQADLLCDQDQWQEPENKDELHDALHSESCTAWICETEKDCSSDIVHNPSQWLCHTTTCLNILFDNVVGAIDWSLEDTAGFQDHLLCGSTLFDDDTHHSLSKAAPHTRVLWFEWSKSAPDHSLIFKDSVAMTDCRDRRVGDRYISRVLASDPSGALELHSPCADDQLEYPFLKDTLASHLQAPGCQAFVCETFEKCVSLSIDDSSQWQCRIMECKDVDVEHIVGLYDWEESKASLFHSDLSCAATVANFQTRGPDSTTVMWLEWSPDGDEIKHPLVFEASLSISDCQGGTSDGWWVSKLLAFKQPEGPTTIVPIPLDGNCDPPMLAPDKKIDLETALRDLSCQAFVCSTDDVCPLTSLNDMSKWACFARDCDKLDVNRIVGVLDIDALVLHSAFSCNAFGRRPTRQQTMEIAWIEWSLSPSRVTHPLMYSSISIDDCQGGRSAGWWISKTLVLGEPGSEVTSRPTTNGIGPATGSTPTNGNGTVTNPTPTNGNGGVTGSTPRPPSINIRDLFVFDDPISSVHMRPHISKVNRMQNNSGGSRFLFGDRTNTEFGGNGGFSLESSSRLAEVLNPLPPRIPPPRFPVVPNEGSVFRAPTVVTPLPPTARPPMAPTRLAELLIPMSGDDFKPGVGQTGNDARIPPPRFGPSPGSNDNNSPMIPPPRFEPPPTPVDSNNRLAVPNFNFPQPVFFQPFNQSFRQLQPQSASNNVGVNDASKSPLPQQSTLSTAASNAPVFYYLGVPFQHPVYQWFHTHHPPQQFNNLPQSQNVKRNNNSGKHVRLQPSLVSATVKRVRPPTSSLRSKSVSSARTKTPLKRLPFTTRRKSTSKPGRLVPVRRLTPVRTRLRLNL